MYIVLHRNNNYTCILGISESKYEAIGKAYTFVENIVKTKNLYGSISNIQCDMLLHDVEPSGKEFIIKRKDETIHIQILEGDDK